MTKRKALFENINIKDILLVLTLVFFVALFGYFYGNSQARSKYWVKYYPLRAKLSLMNLECSSNSPSWMKEILKQQVNLYDSPSNQIAYISSQGELFYCQNGYIDKYPVISEKITENSRFRYASVTKLWTSDAILELVKQQKMELDDPISKYLTEIDNPKDPRISNITIRHLLLHRGGFDRTSVLGNDMFGIGKDICPSHLAELNNIELNFNPDEKMSYSNLGYCLLGEIIARVNGKPYEHVIKQNYDLDKTTIKFINNKRLSDETFYNYIETGLTSVGDIYTAFNYKALASAAGLSGNAIDLAKQVQSMLVKPKPNILSQPDFKCDQQVMRNCYGYAMFPYSVKDNNKVYFRDGNLPGLSSLVVINENRGVVTLLSNGTPKNGLADNDKIKLEIVNYLSQTD